MRRFQLLFIKNSGGRGKRALDCALALILAVSLLLLSCSCGTAQQSSEPEAHEQEISADAGAPAGSDEEYVDYYFKSEKLLDQHYEKHGIDMGFASAEDYEAAASAVINDPDALHKIEAEDGDDVFYLEDTNEFVILSTAGFIRTYFLPDAGKKYFDKQ